MNGERPQGNAALVASGVNKQTWRVGTAPMIASACRCSTPVYSRDEQLGTWCLKCGRRAHPVS